MLHAVEGVGGDPLLENELIFRDPFLIERLIEGFVADISYHQKKAAILYLLTMTYI